MVKIIIAVFVGINILFTFSFLIEDALVTLCLHIIYLSSIKLILIAPLSSPTLPANLYHKIKVELHHSLDY